ncbi:MAG TPA: Stp1/IreP family PP2C-type Ser/Thr phosphatase [Gallionella sp.]|nr:Stp1/IreP family PP2C-type Ser/Thr phosphatase [Gallionella sp.]HUW75096.1 Stp1/IreP family PP2C-type Ser/Thr phosphatase [Gallionella sp.]
MNDKQALEMVSETDVGRVRSNNEDSVATDAPMGIAVLADGMGGFRAGEVASGMAASEILAEMQNILDGRISFEVDPRTGQSEAQKLLWNCISKENSRIYQAAHSQPKYSGMGTTLVVALFHDNKKMTMAHIGDSRLYRLRGDDFQRLTKDHSLVQEQIDLGMITPEQAKLSTNKNLVLRALGIEATVEPEIHNYGTLPDDIYLLCSDGLSDMVNDEDIGMTLRTSGVNLRNCVQQLVQMANNNGGRDNVSVILIRILSECAEPHRLREKVFDWIKLCCNVAIGDKTRNRILHTFSGETLISDCQSNRMNTTKARGIQSNFAQTMLVFIVIGKKISGYC